MWLAKARRRRILPVGVTLNRLAAPLWLFIFGTSSSLCPGHLRRPARRGCGRLGFPRWSLLLLCGLLRYRIAMGAQDHRHVATIELRLRVDLGDLRNVLGEPV